MPDEPAQVRLPESLLSHFQEYDSATLSWPHSRHTIVLRLLQAGGLEAVLWLREHMTDEEIQDFITRRSGRGIEPRRLRFWGVILDIPRQQVDDWVAEAHADPWQRRAG
ncbi:MAG: hypothetical protein WEB88_15220 [Gemmatimonadota bacterium]